MPLTVETGSGNAAADSYVTLAEIAAYALAHSMTWPGTASTQEAQEAIARQGFRFINNESRYPYRGSRLSTTQRGAFPREGCSIRRGPLYASTTIPWMVKEAQCLAAIRICTQGPLEETVSRSSRVKREKIDVLETEYFPDAPTMTTYEEISGLLGPILRDENEDRRLRDVAFYGYEAAEETPFAPGEFDNRSL